MVATFVIDAPALFLLGVLLSLFAVEGRGGRPFLAIFPFSRVMLMTSVALGIALASYQVAPDWMSMYYLEDPRFSLAALAYVALALYYAPAVAGFALGLDLRRRSRSSVALLLLLGLVLQVAVMRHVWDRYVVVGTREAFLAGRATPLASHAEIGQISVVGGLSLLLAFASVVVGHRDRRRRWRRGEMGIPSYLNEREEEIVSTVARRLFPADPSAASLGGELSRYIGHMVLPYRAGVRLVVFALQVMPPLVIRRRRRLTSLTENEKDRYLAALEHHRRHELRQAFVILKTTLCLLYYERPAVLAAVGMDFHCRQESRPPAFPETPRRAEVAVGAGASGEAAG